MTVITIAMVIVVVLVTLSQDWIPSLRAWIQGKISEQ